MGTALGTALIKAGYNVSFAPRHVRNDLYDDVSDVVTEAEIVVLTIPYSSMPNVALEYSKMLSKKKLVLDVSNPRLDRDGPVAVAAQKTGAGIWLSRLLPGAPIVRGFNAVRAEKVEEYGKAGKVVPIAGNDDAALAIASDLARDIGFNPVIVGDLRTAGKLLPYGTGLDGDFTPEELKAFVLRLK